MRRLVVALMLVACSGAEATQAELVQQDDASGTGGSSGTVALDAGQDAAPDTEIEPDTGEAGTYGTGGVVGSGGSGGSSGSSAGRGGSFGTSPLTDAAPDTNVCKHPPGTFVTTLCAASGPAHRVCRCYAEGWVCTDTGGSTWCHIAGRDPACSPCVR
jgi:hypothetical protein